MTDLVCRVIDCHVFVRTDAGPLYLLMQRASNVIYAGSWRMIGGKIDPGEKAWQTAVRELREETGLETRRLWSVPFVNSFYEGVHDRVNVIPVFAAEVDSEKVVLSAEHTAFCWLTYEEAQALLPWPAQREGLRIVHEYIVEGREVCRFVEVDLKKL
jgi:dATP pyrophosphohydrolase